MVDIDNFVVGDKDADLASRFAITGSGDDRSWLVGRFQHHRRGPLVAPWSNRRR